MLGATVVGVGGLLLVAVFLRTAFLGWGGGRLAGHGLLLTCFFVLHQLNWHLHPGRTMAGSVAPHGTVVQLEGKLLQELPGGWVVQALVWNGETVQGWPPVKLRVTGGLPPDARANEVRPLRVRVGRIESARNPGAFDFAAHQARRGIWLQGRLLDEWTGGESEERRGELSIRERFAKVLSAHVPEDWPTHGIIHGMVLGLVSDVDAELIHTFRNTGTLHLFCVSGLHVGMVCCIALYAAVVMGLGLRAQLVLSFAAIFAYTWMTGFGVAAVRASLMAVVFLSAFFFGRRPNLLNSLGLAALVILACDTNVLFHQGFQFSFAALLGIAFLAPPLNAGFSGWLAIDPFLPKKFAPVWRIKLSDYLHPSLGMVAVSLAASVGTALPMVAHYGILAPWGVVANMILIPTAFAILSMSFGSVLLSLVLPFLLPAWNTAIHGLAFFAVMAASAFGSLPGSPWELRTRHDHVGQGVEVTVFDLQRGNAVLFRNADQSWLINAGSRWEAEYILEPALEALGIDELEAMIFTQGDAQHYGGGPRLIERFTPRTIFHLEKEERSRAKKDVLNSVREEQKHGFVAGHEWDLGLGARLSVLHPEYDFQGRTAADRSAVLLLEIFDWHMLLMGGADAEVQAGLLEKHAALHTDVLVRSQGPANRSHSLSVLGQLSPEWVVVPRMPWSPTGRPYYAAGSLAEAGGALDMERLGALFFQFTQEAMVVRSYREGEVGRISARP
ncbi:MAG: ComEC/Rec2 family competence protein [Verrucomicrobiales bacterium]